MLVFVGLDMFIWTTHAMQSPAVEKLVFTPRIAMVKFLAFTSPISELIIRFMDKQTTVFVQQKATKMTVIFVVSLGHWIQEDSHNCLKKLRTSTLVVCNIIHKPSPIRYEGHSCDYFVAKQDGTSCRCLWRLWAKSVVHSFFFTFNSKQYSSFPIQQSGKNWGLWLLWLWLWIWSEYMYKERWLLWTQYVP